MPGFSLLWILVLIFTSGCASSALKVDGPLPSIVKEHKHVVLYGNHPGLRDTGVSLRRGDFFTVLATGSIDMCSSGGCPYRDVRPETGWPLMGRIGEGPVFPPIYSGPTSLIREALFSGKLQLGVREGPVDLQGNPLRPEYYQNNSGFFSVDILVWREKDLDQIEDFFKQMKEKNPSSESIEHALKLLARTKVLDEVNQTKKELKELKGEQDKAAEGTLSQVASVRKDPFAGATDRPDASRTQSKEAPDELLESKEKPLPTGGQEKSSAQAVDDAQENVVPSAQPPSGDVAREDRVRELEAKLAKLMDKLAQMEEAEKKWQEERVRAEQLAKELEERERTEKELRLKLQQAPKGPPVIVVASPKDASKVEINVINVSGVAEGEGGVEEIEIFINGRLYKKGIGQRPGAPGEQPPRRLEFNERIPLEKGPNEVAVRARAPGGATVEKRLTVHYEERAKNVWAVVIGIDEYQKTRKLKFAAKDAQAFSDYLIQNNRVPKENVTLLLNQEATLARVRSALGTHLKNKAGKEDTVIIFFAGHGAAEMDVTNPDGDGLEKYILPYDADLRDLYSTALPMREVAHIFNRIQSERLIFIVDSCYSGASGGRTVSVSDLRATLSDAFLDRVASGKGRVILSASGPNEVSAESERLGHGVFTYYLLEGLRGRADLDKDGAITVDEAFLYVSRQVPQATDHEQHPVKKGMVEGQLILGIVN